MELSIITKKIPHGRVVCKTKMFPHRMVTFKTKTVRHGKVNGKIKLFCYGNINNKIKEISNGRVICKSRKFRHRSVIGTTNAIRHRRIKVRQKCPAIGRSIIRKSRTEVVICKTKKLREGTVNGKTKLFHYGNGHRRCHFEYIMRIYDVIKYVKPEPIYALRPIKGTLANSVDPDQMPQNAISPFPGPQTKFLHT